MPQYGKFGYYWANAAIETLITALGPYARVNSGADLSRIYSAGLVLKPGRVVGAVGGAFTAEQSNKCLFSQPPFFGSTGEGGAKNEPSLDSLNRQCLLDIEPFPND